MEQQTSAPPEIKAVVDFLRSSKSGLKNKSGVLQGSRREFFKGKSAVKALLSPAYAKLKNVPKVTSAEEAGQLIHRTLQFGFYFRVERGGVVPKTATSPKAYVIQIIPQQMFTPDSYYAWFYEGSQLKTYLGGIAMIVVILAGVMFPLWPMKLRIGAWYLSMGGFGLIGLFIAIAIVRLIFYIITVVVASPGIWIFPKLFADVGFVDSFIPAWDWDIPPPKKSKKKRAEKLANGKSKKRLGEKDGSATPNRSGKSTPVPPSEYRGATIEEVPDNGDD